MDWRYIPGFENLYSVNEIGDIYSHYTNKILKPSISNDGYKQCVLHKDHKQYIMNNHRAVALAFIPRSDDSLVVNHKDENKLNCFVNNLEWVTRAENNAYMGNRSAQATFNNNAKKLYVYDKSLNFIGSYLGIAKYARDNSLSHGAITSVIKDNKMRSSNYRTYKNVIYLDSPLEKK